MNTCKNFSLILLSILFISGCSVFPSDGDNNKDEILKSLKGKTWELRSVLENEYAVNAPVIDSMYTITFNSDTLFSAFDICNVCSGDYRIEEDELISFDGIICTEIACPSYPNSIPFSSLLGGNTFPISIQNEELYLTVERQGDVIRNYVFAEYSSIKKALMANPITYNHVIMKNGLRDFLVL